MVVLGLSSSSTTSSSSTLSPDYWIQQLHEVTRDHQKTATRKQLETVCLIFPNGWRTSQSQGRRIARSRKHISRLRSGISSWSGHQGSTVFKLTSRKTKIARSASEPRLQGPLAGGELVNQYHVQRNSMTRTQQITNSLMREVNLETAIDTQSLYKV